MNRAERIVIGLAMGLLCPVMAFLFCWWLTAGLVIYGILYMPERAIALAGLAGLASGVVLDAFFLRKWIRYFYDANVKILVAVYACCSVVAMALFMGLPLGNIALGTLAGAYIGRRCRHSSENGETFSRTAKNAGLFTAGVTGTEAFPIGLLALREDNIVKPLENALGLGRSVVKGPIGVGLIVLLCVVLGGIQFWCTRAAACLLFDGLGKRK